MLHEDRGEQLTGCLAEHVRPWKGQLGMPWLDDQAAGKGTARAHHRTGYRCAQSTDWMTLLAHHLDGEKTNRRHGRRNDPL